jgi:AGZA family xanthine/uracil permease-like MFS transporter
MKWFVRGDIDGFFGLALDNLVQLLVIDVLCRFVLGFEADLLYGAVLPGCAVSLLIGNLYYAWQAKKLAAETGRDDICALPYGINTVSLFAHVFLVMLPAKLAAEAAGLEDPTRVAWQAGLVATVGSGAIEFGGAFLAEKVRQATPRAALLATLAGIALGFISLGFLFRAFARPEVGLVTLGVILLTYFGRVKFKGGLPGGLIAVALGTAIAWITGMAPVGEAPAQGLSLHLPVPVLGDLVQAFTGGHALTYLAVIVPMGLFNVVGSLQNIESAEAAGDSYPTAPSLAVNGLGTLAAALFGSCFPTTIYIGHPGWKSMGARAGYSILNGAFVTLVALTGTLGWIAWAVPIDAGLAIVIWIGIVITAQATQTVPRLHHPAVVIGLLPGVAAWGGLMLKHGIRAGGGSFGPELIPVLQQADVWVEGVFALDAGFIFSSMILAAATVYILERRFRIAALWFLAAAFLSAIGMMHSWTWTPADVVQEIKPAWGFAGAYLAMAALMGAAPWITTEDEGAHG